LDIHSGKQSQTSPKKRSPGTCREREEAVDQGGNTLKQTPTGWIAHGSSFRQYLRTVGKRLLAAYAPGEATDVSEEAE